MSESTSNTRDAGRHSIVRMSLACFTIALGLVVLLGWSLGLDSLTRVFADMVAMKPNTALAFVLAGVALSLIDDDQSPNRWAIGLSLTVALLGGLTLFEYIADANLAIDQILFHEPPNQFGSLARGRMHPTTAFSFLLLGLASALLAADREHRAAQSLILIAAMLAGATCIGYLYGVRAFVGLAVYHQMALHTTIGFLALCVGLLLARPRRGWIVSIVDSGPSGIMARQLLPVAICVPIVTGGLMGIARQYGLFDERYASAVRVTVVITTFVACIWRCAHSLYHVDLERRQVEEARFEGEWRFRSLAESMAQIVWIIRSDGQFHYLNARWFEYTGNDPAAPVDWQSILHQDDLGRFLEQWGRLLAAGQGLQGEFRFRRHDGTFRWHLVRALPVRDKAGRVIQWVGTATDVDTQKRAGEQRYRSLVEATTAIVWNTPASGDFESQQPGWSAFTGQTFDELKGSGWLSTIHPDDRELTLETWLQATKSRSLYQIQHRIRRHDGQYRHMAGRAVPIIDDDGSIHEWIGVHTDIDEQVRAVEALTLAKEAAEAATRAKADFLANMSHEIRTPMNGVLGMTELALGTELNAVQREYLELAQSSAEALLTVIDDILDFSKIEAGKLTLDPVPFETANLVNQTLRCFAPRAQSKGLSLECRVCPEVPQTVIGDAGRLRQILTNLIGNAIKFTNQGEVVVTVEIDQNHDSKTWIRFSVADTGIGIPPEKHASIFAPFEQADSSTTRKYGGTGLGLTISARLIDLMQGRIWVEQNPGGGSIFRFTAHLENADPADSITPANRFALNAG